MTAADTNKDAQWQEKLRQEVEETVRGRIELSPEVIREMGPEEVQLLFYELRVHQIELEMQNEELHRAKDALEDSRSRYVDLYDLAPVGYCTVSGSGMIVQANLTFGTMLGVARGALNNRLFSNFVFQPDQDHWYRLRKQPMEIGVPHTCELRLRRREVHACVGDASSPFWVQLVAKLEQVNAGAMQLHLAISDITERRKAQERLELAASFFEHSHEAIMVTDVDGTIVDLNKAFSRITGYSREEAIGQNSRMLGSGRQDPTFYTAMWNALKSQGHWSGEIWNRRKDGEVYAELLTISSVRNEQDNVRQYVALFSDITAIKTHHVDADRKLTSWGCGQ